MSRSSLGAFAICAALMLAVPASSQDRSAQFLDMMSHLPAAVLSPSSPAMPEFTDYVAARAVGGVFAAAHPDLVTTAPWRVQTGPFVRMPPGQDWTPAVGFSRDDILVAVQLAEPPELRLVLRLTDDAAGRVGAALLANGYATTQEPGFPAFWRGEEDFSLDMTRNDPADPFAFPLPKASRIALEDDVLSYSPSWAGLTSIQRADAPSPVLQAFAAALDLPDWGDRKLVQAMVFSDPTLFSAGPTLDRNLTPLPVRTGGIPAWQNLLLADLSDGTSDLTLIALLYTNKDAAQTAAETLKAEFGSAVIATQVDKTLVDLTGPGAARVIGDGPYLTLYTIETTPDLATPLELRNRGFQVLQYAVYNRTIPLLASAP